MSVYMCVCMYYTNSHHVHPPSLFLSLSLSLSLSLYIYIYIYVYIYIYIFIYENEQKSYILTQDTFRPHSSLGQ